MNSDKTIDSVAVLIPIFNDEKIERWKRTDRLEEFKACIDSIIRSKKIFEQKRKLKSIRIVVVDDGSSPPIREQMPEFSSAVTILRTKQNIGQAAGLSWAIEHLEEDVLVFTDSDCVVGENWLTVIADHYEQFPTHVGVTGPNWVHAEPASSWLKWVTKQESLLMRYNFLRYVNDAGTTSTRVDCRNFSIRSTAFAQLTDGEYFSIAAGPSVSNQLSHHLRQGLRAERWDLGFSKDLLVTHAPLTGFIDQMRTYYDRGVKGNYKAYYRQGRQGLFRSFFGHHFSHHFFAPVKNGGVSSFYTFFLHLAYWIGIVRQPSPE